nr:DUF6382 domain-containing protein [uncultured Lachnoclostridium sp.]
MGKEDICSEWKRDMYHNYLIINGRGEERTLFQEKMLEYNRIEGVLSFQIYTVDNHKQFHYEVTGYQAISCISEKVPLKLSQITMLLNYLLEVLKDAKSYLLDTMDFVLLPEYTFIHLPDYKLGLCYYPGYHVPLQEQLVAFLEFLMGSVDYQDKEAVLFVYSLYMKSKEDNITIQELKSFLEQQTDKDRTTILPDGNNFIKPSETQKLKEPQNYRESYQIKDSKQLSNYCEGNDVNPIKKYKGVSLKLLQKGQLQQRVTSLLINAKDKIHGKDNELKLQKNNEATKSELYNYNKNNEMRSDNSKKYNESGKVLKNIHSDSIKKEAMRESNKQSQYPFIKEKMDQEEEIQYYPLNCYVLLGLLVALCIGIFLYVYQKGFLFQPLNKKINGIKFISILSVMGIVLGYGYLKLFSKERKHYRIVTRTTYQTLEKEDFLPNLISTESDFLEENSGVINYKIENSVDLNIYTNSTLSNGESPMISRESYLPSLSIEDSYDEEECTTILSSHNKEYDTFIPLEPMKYSSIDIKEYPFFIGTAKNNLGYSLTNTVISRYHAKLDKEDNSFILTDLDSTNGTFVNGRKLTANENFEIKQGDTVSFANISFIFTNLNKYSIE